MITLIQHPTRRRALLLAALVSVLLHGGLLAGVRFGATLQAAFGLRGITYVEEDYNRAILLDFSKGLRYPAGYLGFVAPTKVRSLEEVRREAEREARRRQRAEEVARQRAAATAATSAASAEGSKENPVDVPPRPSPTYPGGFGRINTAPIRDQLQRLYDAVQNGQLLLPPGGLRVGVAGGINPDGTLRNYRLIFPSGIPEIDASALAILAAVSESRALGPLHQLTSISLLLEFDQVAQLDVVGFAGNEEEARAIVDLANAALLFARVSKSQDLAVMTMLNNLRISRTGQRVHAGIRLSRSTATETIHQTLGRR
ncbi:MAG: hypothetical protein ACOYNR_02550 [Blastocatellia bacterium]|jgi:hypothetical protein